jgi:uncharacterized membrane protein HdeD (DUF308 family)
VISIVLGFAALLFPFAATLAAELVLGAVLVAAGVAQIGHGVQLRAWKGWGVLVAGGALSILVGGLLLLFPWTGALSLTLILAAFFLIGGAMRAILSFRMRPQSGWGWLLASGLLSAALGLIVLTQWPQAARWLLGLLLGVDLIFSGSFLVQIGNRVRKGAAV